MEIDPYGFDESGNFYKPKQDLSYLSNSKLKIHQPYRVCIGLKLYYEEKVKGVWAFILNILTCGLYKRELNRKIESLNAIEELYQSVDTNLNTMDESENDPEHVYKNTFQCIEKHTIKSPRFNEVIKYLEEKQKIWAGKLVKSFEMLFSTPQQKKDYEKLLKKMTNPRHQNASDSYLLQKSIELFFAQMIYDQNSEDAKLMTIRVLAFHLNELATHFLDLKV